MDASIERQPLERSIHSKIEPDMNENGSEDSDPRESRATGTRRRPGPRGAADERKLKATTRSGASQRKERGCRQSPLSSHVAAYALLIVGKLPDGIMVWMPQGSALTPARNQTILARIVCAP